jgi:WD40 repeat protein
MAPEVMAFSPDKRMLACLPGRVWSLATQTTIDEFDHNESLGVFLPGMDTLMTCVAKTGVLCLYDTANAQVVRKRDEDNIPMTQQMPKDSYTAMALAPDGRSVVMGAKSGNLYRIAAESLGAEVSQPLSVGQEVTVLAFSPDGKYLAVGGAQGRIHLIDLVAWQEVRQLGGSFGAVKALAVLPMLSLGRPIGLVSAHADQSLRLWDTGDGTDTWRTFVDDLQDVMASFDGRLMACTAGDGLWLWDLTVAESVQPSAPEPIQVSFGKAMNPAYRLHRLKGEKISAIALTEAPPSYLVATGNEDGHVDLWRLNGTIAVPHEIAFDSLKVPIQSVAMARTAEWVGASTPDGVMFVWEPAVSRVAKRLNGHTDTVTTMVFAEGAPVLVSGSLDGTVRVWHRKEQRQIYCLQAHAGGVKAVAFDGPQRLLSAGWDATVAVWDLASGKELHRLSLPLIQRLPAPARGYAPPIHSLRLQSTNGPLVVTWHNHALVALEIMTGRQVWKVDGVSAADTALFSADARRMIVLAGRDAELWDAACSLRLDTIEPPPLGKPPAFLEAGFSQDGMCVALRSSDYHAGFCLVT